VKSPRTELVKQRCVEGAADAVSHNLGRKNDRGLRGLPVCLFRLPRSSPRAADNFTGSPRNEYRVAIGDTRFEPFEALGVGPGFDIERYVRANDVAVVDNVQRCDIPARGWADCEF